MNDRWTQFTNNMEIDAGAYKPWRSGNTGYAANFLLEPSEASGEPNRYIPYLQPISIEISPDGRSMAVLCASTGHRVFIEGTNLDDLARDLSERRIKSIHQFDAAKHGNQTSDIGMVTNITVEQSS